MAVPRVVSYQLQIMLVTNKILGIGGYPVISEH